MPVALHTMPQGQVGSRMGPRPGGHQATPDPTEADMTYETGWLLVALAGVLFLLADHLGGG